MGSIIIEGADIGTSRQPMNRIGVASAIVELLPACAVPSGWACNICFYNLGTQNEQREQTGFFMPDVPYTIML